MVRRSCSRKERAEIDAALREANFVFERRRAPRKQDLSGTLIVASAAVMSFVLYLMR